MNDIRPTTSESTGTGDAPRPALGKRSLHKHLLNKAEQCSDYEKKYIEKLGNAKGKDVFKYLLLLNCVECESYVTEVQLQAQKIFQWSVGISAAGFFMIMASAATAIASQMVNQRGLEIAYITGVSGVITTFISTVFFTLYYRCLRRMDEFHTQLREVQKIVMSLFLSGLLQKGPQGSEVMQRMIDQLMPSMDIRFKSNGNGKTRMKDQTLVLENQ